MKEEKLRELIQDYFDVKRNMDNLKSTQDAIKSEIKLLLSQMNINKYEDTYGNIVTLGTQTRENIDKKKLKSLVSPEMFQSVIKTSEFEVLRVTDVDQRGRWNKS